MPLPAHPSPRSRRSISVGRTLGCLVLLAALAGCGSGGSTAATTTTSTVPVITRADFITRAKAICQLMNDKEQAVPDPGSDPDKVVDALQLEIAATSDAIQQLRSLPIPAGDEATLQDIYLKVDQVLSDVTGLKASVRDRDSGKAVTLQATIEADTTAANNASNAYGLTVCGSR